MGFTTIIPTMPAPVCIRTGCVAQWYMKTPACLAVEAERDRLLAGAEIVLNAVSGLTSEEWKSIECGIVDVHRPWSRR